MSATEREIKSLVRIIKAVHRLSPDGKDWLQQRLLAVEFGVTPKETR